MTFHPRQEADLLLQEAKNALAWGQFHKAYDKISEAQKIVANLATEKEKLKS